MRKYNSIDDEHYTYSPKYIYWIATVLVIVYIFELLFPEFVLKYATHPLDLFSSSWYTIITSIFLHGSVFHLLSNLLFLLLFGRVVEKKIGPKILVVFLVSGIIANIISHSLSLLTSSLFTSLGASGAIAGIIALGLFLHPFAFTTLFIIPIPLFVFGWLAMITDVFGLFVEDGINHFAHLGGYVGVILVSFLLEQKHITQMKKGFLIQIILVLVTILALVYFGKLEKMLALLMP
jgi:rhomboid protease GluP